MTISLRAAAASPLLASLWAPLWAPLLALVALLALSGCGVGGSAGGESTSDARADLGTDREPAAKPGPPGASGSDSESDAAVTTGRTAVTPVSRDVISTGRISLRAKSLAGPRADVLRLVTSWNGVVTDEQTDSDHRGRLYESTMTLRVPSATFSVAMASLAQVAQVQEQSRTSEDVTTEVIDNRARVRAAERSIRQIEALLGRAKDLDDIIAIEADLTRRQSDLDSLKSQQAWLADQTSLSTITVVLSRSHPAAPPEQEEQGFLAGLRGGWEALTGATALLLTGLGAVLPFAVLAALVGVPLRIWLRRRNGAALSGGSAPARTA